MKIFAIDDYTRVINSETYKEACMNVQFNMLENRLTDSIKVIKHIEWTDKKVKEWQKECPHQHSSEQYNEWLENKFEEYKSKLMIA